MAADAAGDLGLLAANADRSIRDLRNAVRGARAQDGRRGTRFLDLIDAALDALLERVKAAENMAASAQDERERRAAARFAQRINYDLRLLHEAAPWVESARQGSLGLGLVYFVDEIVAGLLKSPADVVMSPTAAYMYSTVYDIPKWLETSLNVAIPEGPTAIVIAYPVHEPDSLFLHLLIAHELAHSAVPAAGLVQAVRKRDPDEQMTGKALGAAAARYRRTHKTTEKESQVQVATILRDWLVELLCDALGLAFLGPSFIFTFAAFSTPFEQTAHESHPPFGLRTEALVKHLDLAGWREVAESVAPKTLAWILGATSTPADAERPYFESIEAAARHLAPAVTAVARDHIGDKLYKHEAEDVRQLTDFLEARILPAQVGEVAAERRSIVFAGWAHAFSRPGQKDEPASLAAITADRDHQRFLTKALEMSIVLETWNKLP